MPRPALPDTSDAPAGRIHVGVGGWTFAPWRGGVFYPATLAQRRELEYASRQLTAIEINGTYYRAQKPGVYAGWREQTPPGFVFTAKAPRRITASRHLPGTGAHVEDFIDAITALGDRLGALLWQFEPGRAPSPDALAAFIGMLPRRAGGLHLRHALELRDPEPISPALLGLLRERNVALVFAGSEQHPSLADITADFIYARLMQSRADLACGYPAAALDAWARRAGTWAGGGDPADLPHLLPPQPPTAPRDVFVFFIAGAKQRNPAAARTLIERLQPRAGRTRRPLRR